MLQSNEVNVMSRERDNVVIDDEVTCTVDLHSTCRPSDISSWRFGKNVFTLECASCHKLFHHSCIQHMPKLSSSKDYEGVNWHCKLEACQQRLPERKEDGISPTFQRKRRLEHSAITSVIIV